MVVFPNEVLLQGAARATQLRELIHAEAEFVGFAVGEQFVPGDFALLQAGHAAQHAAESGLDAGGDLVVAVAGGDAVDEGPLLVAVGEGQVVAECAVGGKLAGAVSGCCVESAMPRLACR